MHALGDPTDKDSLNEAAPHGDESRPSRTEQTRAATAVNKLGIQLTSLSEEDLRRLELPERVHAEIEICQQLKPKSRGRQNRLIGQLLRAEDHEDIRARLDDLSRLRRLSAQQEKVTERWLERLLADGVSGVEALIAEYPTADRQRLRLLTRSARKDPASRPGKRARRELLRAIRDLRA
jgi:ribosome-associated protein